MKHIVCADLVCGCEYTHYMSASLSAFVFVFVSVCVTCKESNEYITCILTPISLNSNSRSLSLSFSPHLCVSSVLPKFKRYCQCEKIFKCIIYWKNKYAIVFTIQHHFLSGLISFLSFVQKCCLLSHQIPSLCTRIISIGLCFLSSLHTSQPLSDCIPFDVCVCMCPGDNFTQSLKPNIDNFC